MKTTSFAFALAALSAVAVHASPETSCQVLKADVLRGLEDSEKRLIGLAEAMPADKLGWRPSPTACARRPKSSCTWPRGNYLIANILGLNPPEGVAVKNLEKSTTLEKARIVEELIRRASRTRARR